MTEEGNAMSCKHERREVREHRKYCLDCGAQLVCQCIHMFGQRCFVCGPDAQGSVVRPELAVRIEG